MFLCIRARVDNVMGGLVCGKPKAVKSTFRFSSRVGNNIDVSVSFMFHKKWLFFAVILPKPLRQPTHNFFFIQVRTVVLASDTWPTDPRNA